MDQVFELFDTLGASDEQLDFAVVFTSAINGVAGLDCDKISDNMEPLFETIINQVPAPNVDLNGPFQMQISALDYDTYTGVEGLKKSFEDLYHLECKFVFKISKERIEKVKFSLLKSILD